MAFLLTETPSQSSRISKTLRNWLWIYFFLVLVACLFVIIILFNMWMCVCVCAAQSIKDLHACLLAVLFHIFIQSILLYNKVCFLFLSFWFTNQIIFDKLFFCYHSFGERIELLDIDSTTPKLTENAPVLLLFARCRRLRFFCFFFFFYVKPVSLLMMLSTDRTIESNLITVCVENDLMAVRMICYYSIFIVLAIFERRPCLWPYLFT